MKYVPWLSEATCGSLKQKEWCKVRESKNTENKKTVFIHKSLLFYDTCLDPSKYLNNNTVPVWKLSKSGSVVKEDIWTDVILLRP